MNTGKEAAAWEPWSFEERRRLARYVSDEAEDSFPVADRVSWRLEMRADRLQAVQSIYERLANLPDGQRLFYSIEKYDPSADRQPVRSPREILETRHGTCLDLTLLFCGLCLSQRLCPVAVVAREDHAYALLALNRSVGGLLPAEELALAKGPVEDLELLRRLVAGDDAPYLALECTGFAEIQGESPRKPLTFEAAVEAGRRNLQERGLRFALDVASARYLLGEPSLPERAGEPPWPMLRRRWVRWEEARKDDMRFGEPLERNVLDSQVLEDFGSFLQDVVWHKKVEDLIKRITSPTVSDADVRKLQRRLQDVKLSARYSTILDDLKTALAHPGPRSVQEHIGHLESKTGLRHRAIPASQETEPEARELASLRELQKALFELQDEVNQPRHGRCLLVLGEAGSGKTHLSVTFQPDLAATVPAPGEDWIPSPHEEWRSLLLWLRRDDPGGKLQEKIEGLIDRITGYSWKSLESFQEYLRRAENWLKARDPRMSYGLPRVVVVLDDLDRWLRTGALSLDELERLILETSQLHSIYWVLMLQHTAFPEVAQHRRFWSAYAWSKADRNSDEDGSRARRQIGSWIDLDRLNQLERLGIRIVEQVSKEEDSEPIGLTIGSGTPTERDLSNPQNAWTLLLCHRERKLDVDYLVNLNFIGYVERFWELRREKIDPRPLAPLMVQRMVGVAAAVMSRELGFQPLRAELASAVARVEKDRSELQDPEKAEAGIRILESAGLWQEVETRDERGPVLRLELRNQFFWSFQIAQHLAGRLMSREPLDLATLLPEGTDLYLREGVIEFLLLLMSREGEPGQDSAVEQLWLQALQLAGPTRASAWIGAAKADRSVQRMVVEASREIRNEGEREIFAFLYFVGEADPEVLPPTDRMRLLQPYFPMIAAAGLVDYFLHVLFKALDEADDRRELLGMLRCLPGVEVLKETRRVAYAVADAVLRVCAGAFKDALDFLIDYARQESGRIQEAPDPPPPPPPQREEGKHYLREWVFFATLDSGADIQRPNGPADLFEILWQVFWYDAHRLNVILNPVGFEMEAQANTVLGYQYRHSDGRHRRAYQELIADLAHAEGWYRRKLAFFLIRHSAVTGGKYGVRVDEEFQPTLERLFLDSDPRVQKSVQKFYEDFRVNLEGGDYDFPGLARKRDALLMELGLDFPKPQDRRDNSSTDRRR